MTQSTEQAALRRVRGRLSVTFAALAAVIAATMVRDATGWGFMNAVIGLGLVGVIASQFWVWRARGGRVWVLALGVVVTLGALFALIQLIP